MAILIMSSSNNSNAIRVSSISAYAIRRWESSEACVYVMYIHYTVRFRSPSSSLPLSSPLNSFPHMYRSFVRQSKSRSFAAIVSRVYFSVFLSVMFHSWAEVAWKFARIGKGEIN